MRGTLSPRSPDGFMLLLLTYRRRNCVGIHLAIPPIVRFSNSSVTAVKRHVNLHAGIRAAAVFSVARRFVRWHIQKDNKFVIRSSFPGGKVVAA